MKFLCIPWHPLLSKYNSQTGYRFHVRLRVGIPGILRKLIHSKNVIACNFKQAHLEMSRNHCFLSFWHTYIQCHSTHWPVGIKEGYRCTVTITLMCSSVFPLLVDGSPRVQPNLWSSSHVLDRMKILFT